MAPTATTQVSHLVANVVFGNKIITMTKKKKSTYFVDYQNDTGIRKFKVYKNVFLCCHCEKHANTHTHTTALLESYVILVLTFLLLKKEVFRWD